MVLANMGVWPVRQVQSKEAVKQEAQICQSEEEAHGTRQARALPPACHE